MWHRTRKKLITFTVVWFVLGTGASIAAWKMEMNGSLLVGTVAATLFGTVLPLMVLFDDWRLHRH